MTEKDQSVMIAALVAVVAIVGLVVQFGGATGMLPTDYGSAYKPTYPSLVRGECPEGYTATDVVCTGSVIEDYEGLNMCYKSGDLYCVKEDSISGNSIARGYGAEERLIAREQDCFKTPADEQGNTYYLCG